VDILDRIAYDGQVAGRVVFFADILGFGALSLAPGASGAQDALSAISNLLSRNDVLGDLLNWQGWEDRYALSDSLFLTSSDPVGAVAAASELFFNLAFISHSGDQPVLMRGGLARGEAIPVPPIFPDTASSNLVGSAVVKAVRLEGSPAKGPRLFVDEEIASDLQEADSPVKWLLSAQEGYRDLLWLLPPNPTEVNGPLIGSLCAKILPLVLRHQMMSKVLHHYLGYLDLLTRSLERLSQHSPDQTATVVRLSGLPARVGELEKLFDSAEADPDWRSETRSRLLWLSREGIE
jgi:hypothetical protein